ncbi:ATP-dependent DNA ligase [Alicyclobacillus acidocaldarius]|uniref:DNA ligase (ATP) n=1 Tax=Alicyclobacillus acidocaldarius subsp. acidocaldarius (strain ATCC 27009 / DSM 446 / BCRC 14685 / JCM 5260 / KCTC 1825 / NBRC 15652 / NCIMB 11725 / NRRL B-14509 / 104-IA) TaxID=521098 RepID=C8WX39_ALIAD|nr:DNA ligase [Alicyclobacillus acidocaldarius]ACV58661.1 ATP dependent DNA ligase [Alicyclobacillus acidocaldarius subsp. acidocaldarius DSM 446]
MPFFRPFEPISSTEVPVGDAWIAQVKWDGVRAVAEVSGDGVQIWNRHGRLRTDRYPEIASALRPFRGCAFDGEVVALTQGRPDFYRVLRRDRAVASHEIEQLVREIPVWYAVFDVVRMGGEWVGDWPLAKRLDWMLEHLSGVEHVLTSEGEVDTEALFAATKQLGLEGIVCKRVDSTYAPGGKDGRWVKVKHERNAIAAVGGVVYRDGAPNALMLGLFDDKARLFHVGNAGAGRLPRRAWRQLVERVLSHETSLQPFARAPKAVRTCRFAHPVVAVKVRFAEWTPKGTMRHPVLLAELDIPATPAACSFAQADP